LYINPENNPQTGNIVMVEVEIGNNIFVAYYPIPYGTEENNSFTEEPIT
jgi:hypothetical protein